MRVAILLLLVGSLARPCEEVRVTFNIPGPSADPLFPFEKNGRIGFIDVTGKIVIPAKLETSDAAEFHDGRLRVRALRGGHSYVDTSGETVIPGPYFAALDFSEGLAAVEIKQGDRWGFIDSSGKTVIPPLFDFPYGGNHSFSEGLVLVSDGGHDGYIDHTGRFAIAPTILRGADFHDGIARAVLEGPCATSTEGVCGSPIVVGGSATDAPRPLKACKFGYIDKLGHPISPARFDEVQDFSEGLAAVRVDGRWGYIDRSGKIVIQPNFFSVRPFSEDLAAVWVDRVSGAGYIDKTGAFAIPSKFTQAFPFSDGAALIADATGFGYTDKLWRGFIREQIVTGSSFSHGIARIQMPGSRSNSLQQAYVDRTGKIIFTFTP